MHILIPCKNLSIGKSRLSGCLDPFARRELCERLLIQTLELATALVEPRWIRIVTADLDAVTIANRYGAAWIPDQGAGLNVALEDARSALLPTMSDEEAMLILPIDLAFASADVFWDMLSCPGDVVIAPDESGTGTNLLLLRSIALRNFQFAYGRDSYAAHMDAAAARSLAIGTFRDRQLAFDVDEPMQYATWRLLQQHRQGAALQSRGQP